MTKSFEALCAHVAQLNALLESPHFGLASWCGAYAEHMRYISEYWAEN